jgi:hypothetical protein
MYKGKCPKPSRDEVAITEQRYWDATSPERGLFELRQIQMRVHEEI